MVCYYVECFVSLTRHGVLGMPMGLTPVTIVEGKPNVKHSFPDQFRPYLTSGITHYIVFLIILDYLYFIANK